VIYRPRLKASVRQAAKFNYYHSEQRARTGSKNLGFLGFGPAITQGHSPIEDKVSRVAIHVVDTEITNAFKLITGPYHSIG
jgi:hypothetical protein